MKLNVSVLLMQASLNSAIKRAKHMELSERDASSHALIDALERTLLAWHRRELHVRAIASETAAAIDRRATELPVCPAASRLLKPQLFVLYILVRVPVAFKWVDLFHSWAALERSL